MKEQVFYYCKHCGNLATKLNDSGVDMVCCGEEMQVLTANTRDGAREKHIPEVEVNKDMVKVQVGSVLHPMVPEHYIEWVVLQTNKGFQVHYLQPGEEPKAEFKLVSGEKVLAVYEYCNLHGLYKKDLA